MNEFSISANNLCWINGKKDDPEDLCLHGCVKVKIGNEIFEYDATVSATALYLLKTITEEYIMKRFGTVPKRFFDGIDFEEKIKEELVKKYKENSFNIILDSDIID